MKFDPTTRTLTLEPADCRGCRYQDPQGTRAAMVTCPTCNGTGDGPRGGRNKCRQCHGWNRQDGLTRVPDHNLRRPCDACGGDYVGADLESFCDHAPLEAIEAMPMVMVLLRRDNTWNETNLGFGMIFTITDHGTRWAALRDYVKDAEPGATLAEAAGGFGQGLMMEVRAHLREDPPQAVRIAHYERGETVATLHDFLVVRMTHTGYHVLAVSDLPESYRQFGIAETRMPPCQNVSRAGTRRSS